MKKLLAVGVIVLFIGMTISSSTGINLEKQSIKPLSSGNTLYVGGSGTGNYSNIQDAIDNASDADTVYVYDDSSPYIETLKVNKSINLIGEDKETTIIDGADNGHIITITSDNVTVRDFTIQNSGKYGMHLRSNYSKIIGNIIKNNELRGIYFGGLSHDNIVSENIITNNGIGIQDYKKEIPIAEPENNIISDNIISFNHNGIVLGSSWGNIVTGNTISNNELDGIQVFLRGENIITDNNIENNRKGIWVFDTNKNTISGNDIINNAAGIDLIDSESNIISNNNLSYNNNGIPLETSENNVISNNTISDSNVRGIYLLVSENNEISNNTISNNNVGLHVYGLSYNNIISDNIFFNDGFFIEWSSNTYSNNTVNGKPFVYLERESNKVIDIDSAGQIILMHCSSITIQNQDLSNAAVGIELGDCTNCLITENRISNHNRYGIYIFGSDNSVSRNYITNNSRYGIYIEGSDISVSRNYITNNNLYGIYVLGSDNSVSRNYITNNSCGLFWKGSSNTVEENNFIFNNRDARFQINHNGGWTTKWVKNYWDGPMVYPKIIFGKKDFLLFPLLYGGLTIPLPWICFDWHPAKEPYDIGM